MSGFINAINAIPATTGASFSVPPRISFSAADKAYAVASLPIRAAGSFTTPINRRLSAGPTHIISEAWKTNSNIASKPQPPYQAKLGFGTQEVDFSNKSAALGVQTLSAVVETPLSVAMPFALMPFNSLYDLGKTTQKLLAPKSLTPFEHQMLPTFLSDQVAKLDLHPAAKFLPEVIAGTLDVATAAVRPFTAPVEEGFMNLYNNFAKTFNTFSLPETAMYIIKDPASFRAPNLI